MSAELTWVRKWRRRVCWKKTEMMDERDDHLTHSTPSITHFDLHSLPICVSLFLLKSTTILHPQLPQHSTWYPLKTRKVHDYSLEGSYHTSHATIKGISRLLTSGEVRFDGCKCYLRQLCMMRDDCSWSLMCCVWYQSMSQNEMGCTIITIEPNWSRMENTGRIKE